MEDSALRAQQPPKSMGLRDAEALTLSKNVINKYILLYAAAGRAGNQPHPDPVLQRKLVCEVRQLLTKQFSITVIHPNEQRTATDFNSLLELIQLNTPSLTFNSGLQGNLSLESITRDGRGRRVLQIQGLRYTLATVTSEESYLFPGSDKFTVVETQHGTYKIKAVIRKRLTQIPFGN